MSDEFGYQLYRELLALSKEKAIDEGDIDRTFKIVTESIARNLNIPRASIWLYNENRTAIVCKDLYESESKLHSSGAELCANDFPAYFKYLSEERTLAAHDAHSNPATFEFTEPYLKPNQIVSMLDAPIRIGGKMVGVICCEQTVSRREWHFSEEAFLGHITEVLARAFQVRERITAQTKLQHLNATLEESIKQQTAELKDVLTRSAQSAKLISLGEMAGGIAHEVNTPLNSIMFAAECVRELMTDKEIDREELNDHMQLIEDTSMRIAKIIQGLKWFAQDQKVQVFEHYDLREVIEQSLTLCQQRFKNGNIEVRWTKPEAEIKLLCQPVQLGQVVLNLLNNSFDAASAESNGWIEIKIIDNEQAVKIEVSNSGKKISEKVCAKLFQPFFTTKAPGKGTGLGLSISRGIVQQHSGEISVDRSQKHTCFVVLLPRHSKTVAA